MFLRLTDTKTGLKSVFHPEDPSDVRMYVCGPTVYDRAHLGNARSAVVFDLLFRTLRQIYGHGAVTYARNFTDIDDKIITAAKATHPEMNQIEAIGKITEETIGWYHEDMDVLGVMRPTHEPRATGFIVGMQDDIARMIRRGVAYEMSGHVFFSAPHNPLPGYLSGRKDLSDESVHRIDPHPLKRHPADFVMWKPASPGEPAWASPWGDGRPGWHIECSTMATRLLGPGFDIHGGGSDLIFPHHDNEVAQASACDSHAGYARTWVHNGMITVSGQKMSKSLGNFTTVKDLRDRLPGGAIRLALLSANYRSGLDWTPDLELQSFLSWRKFSDLAKQATRVAEFPDPVIDALKDDLNTAGAIAALHALHDARDADGMAASLAFIGINPSDDRTPIADDICEKIDAMIAERAVARERRDFATSDRIRGALTSSGVEIGDEKTGVTWRRGFHFNADADEFRD